MWNQRLGGEQGKKQWYQTYAAHSSPFVAIHGAQGMVWYYGGRYGILI